MYFALTLKYIFFDYAAELNRCGSHDSRADVRKGDYRFQTESHDKDYRDGLVRLP